jgi:hypothetical protein
LWAAVHARKSCQKCTVIDLCLWRFFGIQEAEFAGRAIADHLFGASKCEGNRFADFERLCNDGNYVVEVWPAYCGITRSPFNGSSSDETGLLVWIFFRAEFMARKVRQILPVLPCEV